MIGNLFQQRFVDDEQQPASHRVKLKKKGGVDSDSDENNLSPEERRALQFEKLLKSRIFLSDRIEKIDKALLTLGAISKDVYYCSHQELANFKLVFDQECIKE